ncbi:MAG: anaerobic ribonucleoside-triphosphate reductase [Syntrophales bacterium]
MAGKNTDSRDSTDITLFVRTSSEDVVQWNRQKIIDALILETYVDSDTAEAISREVEKQIFSSSIGTLTAPLIRELVNAKLIERGLEQERRMHARLGFPIYDIGHLIMHRNRENANIPHWPEGTNLTLAGGIKREYALHNIFSREVSDAHLRGDLHLHDLGYADRPYSSKQTLEHIKKFGLDLPNIPSIAKPAKHAEVLLAHMIRFSAALQGNFAGPIEWDAVNISFAPYLTRSSDEEVKQLAQMLVYEFSQLAVSRGGQVMYTDLGFYWEIPDYFEHVPAIGPGGKLTGKNYGDYAGDARRFVRAIFDVMGEGDAAGKPFFFPRPVIHISEKFFRTEGHEDFLRHVCGVAAEKGNPFFVFDRQEAGRPRGPGAKSFWKSRQAAVHNATLNLPRLGYKARGDDARLFSLLSGLMDVAARAHAEKKSFIEKLLSFGESGPLAFLSMDVDGSPYLDMNCSTYLIGVVGLHELVTIHRGAAKREERHGEFGLKIIKHMGMIADKLSRKYGLKIVLAQTPAETAAHRFARLDLKCFSPDAGRHIKGDLLTGGVYYSNSSLLAGIPSLGTPELIKAEGDFHPFIKGGALNQIWLGETLPAPELLSAFVKEVFYNTKNSRITFSPEFTLCKRCKEISRGHHKEQCAACGSRELDGISKITGYFAMTSSLNKGKLAELRDVSRSINSG